MAKVVKFGSAGAEKCTKCEKTIYNDQIFHTKCVNLWIKQETERKKQEAAAKLLATKSELVSSPSVAPKDTILPVTHQSKPAEELAHEALVEKYCPYCAAERADPLENYCGDCGGNLKS